MDRQFLVARVRAVASQAAAMTVIAASLATAELAEGAQVHFDIVPLTVCRDVTTESFAFENPGEKLVAAEIEVSTLLASGSQQDVTEYDIRVSSPNRTLIVTDYSPKTELASEYAGSISVEKKDEATRSAGISVDGAWDHLVRISGVADRGSKDSTMVRYELHAPQEAVTASGTIERGYGVYFRLRPSRQSTLEGSRRFLMTFRVPQAWRGDYLQVHCVASGVDRGVMRSFDEPVVSGRRDFFLPLYLAGDAEAKRAAENMVHAEVVVQKVLLQHRERLAAATPKKKKVLDQFVALWQRAPEPSVTPMQEIEQLLFSHEPQRQQVQLVGLPTPFEAAIGAYLQSRWTLRGLAAK